MKIGSRFEGRERNAPERRRRTFLSGMATACATLAAPRVFAQGAASTAAAAWPTKPVHIIVPNVPGGGTDILARHLESELSKLWSQPIVIDYKAGGGTVIGTDFVAKSPPDGHTLGMIVTSHVINPALRKQMPFDTRKDLSAITLTATNSLLLAASPKFGPDSLDALIAYAKANPGKVSFATAGAGSSMHLAGELLKQLAGIDMLHVPYKGSGGAYGDVFDGRVDLMIDPLFSSLPQLTGKRMKAIAVLNTKRDPTAPDIPAAGETLQGLDVQSINGVVVPSATPRALVQRINADFVKALKSPELRKRLLAVGLEPVGSTPEYFDEFIASEIQRWDKVVKAGNIALE